MNTLKIMFIPLFLFLVSCTTISEIVPVGKDTYMLTASDKWSGAELKAELFKMANVYCLNQNKELMPVRSSSTPNTVQSRASAEVVFRCLLAGDPELKRPDFKESTESLGEK